MIALSSLQTGSLQKELLRMMESSIESTKLRRTNLVLFGDHCVLSTVLSEQGRQFSSSVLCGSTLWKSRCRQKEIIRQLNKKV